jgi:small membrane protein
MITPLQILLLIFALFAFSRVILRLKDNQISVREFLFWGFIWLTAIIVSIQPDIITFISTFVGIGRGVDVLIYVSITLLFYIIFRILIKIEKLQQEITTLTRAIAIKNVQDKKDKK